MPSHGQKLREKYLDSSEEGRSEFEHTRTGSLDGESATGRRESSGASQILASDTTCSNEQLLSLQTSIESGFTSMSGSLAKAIKDCFSTMVDKFESNLLDTKESDPEISGPDEPTSAGTPKERENPSIESLLESRGKAASQKTGEASNEDPKSAVLDSIKQDLKADEVGDPIDGELSVIVNSLLTKGMADDKLQGNQTQGPASQLSLIHI